MSRRPLGRRLALLATAAATALTTVALAPASSAENPALELFRPRLVTVDTPTRGDKDRLQQLGLDLTEHAGHDYVEVVLHSAADLARLSEGRFDWEVRIPDLLQREAEVTAANREYAAATATSSLPSGRDTYRTLTDYENDLSKLAEAKPKLVKKIALNHTSLEGRSVQGVEIGSDVTRPESGRPVFALFGLHHAREWPSGELAMEFAIDLVKNYGTDTRITGLLDRARVIVVPVVNPDGFDLSRTDGGVVDLRDLNEVDPLGGTTSVVLTPGHAYKRKNCRIVDGQTAPAGACRATLTSNLGAGVGVDLNRNYGGFWGGPGAAGPEPKPTEIELGVLDPTYRGPSAFSEPETQNVRELVSSRQVTTLISNHTFSNLVLRPNGVHPDTIGHDGLSVGNAPDEEALKALGKRFTDANGYQNIHGWELYDTTGTTEDWSYNATGGFGYTFEIGPDEFHPPFPDVVDEYVGAGEYAGMGNREAYLRALEATVDASTHSVLTGRAPAGATLKIAKTFRTPTWTDSIEDSVESTLRVGEDGRFTWHMNPSTRPVLEPREITKLAEKPSRSQTFDGGRIAPTKHADHEFTVDSTTDLLKIDLDWPTPDDLDLEVYRKEGASLVKVASSGNTPPGKESAQVRDAQAGTYVLRVLNYASVTPSYTLTAAQYDATTVTTPGRKESYTLTCSYGGKVLSTQQLQIDRGQARSLDLRQCRTLAATAKPRISGKARVGRTLRATAGAWSPAAQTVSYRWLRAGKPIPRATKARYTLTRADRGKRIRVRVTAARSTWLSSTVTSPSSMPVR